jgi:DNA-binding NarL/FixJ family response regulator
MEPNPKPAISVLLMDDNVILAESMPRFLRRDPCFSWAGWVEDATTLIERVSERSPSIVLMDVDIPGVDTFELVRELSKHCPRSKVVMFSGHVRQDYAEAAIDAGAHGYLHKDDDLPSLLANLKRVDAGEIVLSPLVRQTLWRR